VKPLGTITMCFPYVDEDTKATLQSIMEKAENITDFTERLCDKVCSEPSTPLLEYFAFFFPYKMDHLYLIDRLVAAGKVSVMAEPFLLQQRAYKGESITWNDMKQSLNKALEAAPNDWIAAQLYTEWRITAEIFFPEIDVDVGPIEAITSSIRKNKELAFFESYLYLIQATSLRKQMRHQEYTEKISRALTIARKHDDQIMAAQLLTLYANATKNTDVKRAIDILISTKELSEQLGFTSNLGLIEHQLGHIMALRGELNAALRHQSEHKRIQDELSISHRTDVLLASLYNQMSAGEKAMELVEPFTRPVKPIRRGLSYAHLHKAWALVNLGRYEEARTELGIAHKLVMKSGSPEELTWVRLVEGHLDKMECEFDGAMECFTELLDNLKDDPVPLFQNICLLNLTEIEIEILPEDSLNKKTDSSGPWMMRLIEQTEKNDLPGIAARALLLKAKLRQRQGQYDEVRKLLKEVQKIGEAPSMRYLNDLTISMFPDIVLS
jgi:tetratricopeptide (TPR) repeat protein